MKPPFALSLFWLASILAVFIFAAPLSDLLFFFFPFVGWGLVGTGIFLAFWALFLYKNGGRRCVATIAVCLLGLSLYFTSGFEWGRVVLFQIRRPHYEQLLSEAVQSGDVPGWLGRTEDGPPKRYAFYWQRGILDNWAAVIHDPTGDIARVNNADNFEDLSDPSVSNLIGMFGGDFYRCQPVGGGWYICWFT